MFFVFVMCYLSSSVFRVRIVLIVGVLGEEISKGGLSWVFKRLTHCVDFVQRVDHGCWMCQRIF